MSPERAPLCPSAVFCCYPRAMRQRTSLATGRLPRRVCRALLFGICFFMALGSRASLAVPYQGILQFHPIHNLQTSDCLASSTCSIVFEDFANVSSWLAQIAARSNLAVLHWDAGIPWLVFDADPPPGADRVNYYDARLDAPTLGWLGAFVAHFQALPASYLAVSILSAERDRLAPLHLGLEQQQDFPTSCPDFSPGTQISVDAGNGPVSFDLARS